MSGSEGAGTGTVHAVTMLADLEARGLVHDSTDRDALGVRLASGEPVTVYHGVDPTAGSLHVGNLVGLLVLRRFQDAGHRPIVLAGGATGMIGDPSGRSAERPMLAAEELEANVAAIGPQLELLLDFTEGPARAVSVNNLDWTGDLGLIPFLRDVGKHVTVGTMLAKESVRTRLASEHGISYTEFTYMLLQAHDYLWLHDHHGCELQVGGSDQWGNITAGIDLVRRVRGASVHGITWPLLMDAAGAKLGKSTGGRVWLSPDLTSPYQLFQHFVQAGDDDVERLLGWFTLLPVAEIAAVMADHRAEPARRSAQRRLAREVATLVHGSGAAAAAEEASGVLFGAGVIDASEAALAAVAGEVPSAAVDPAVLESGLDPVDLLALTDLVGSRAEARRAVAQGGVYVNDERVAEGDRIGFEQTLHGRWLLVRRGKRSYHLLDASGPQRR